MLNPFYGEAMRRYLIRFDEAFTEHPGPLPRAQYHDSFEYDGNWTPDLFDEFEKRRGYRLQDHLTALFGEGDPENIARVKCDYRETISDMLLENVILPWAAWAREKGCLTRNQAHGSPGNLLDLYAAADIPETEMFNKDRDPLVAKFASSAAHATGKTKVAAETGTWLREHFTVTLGDMKDLVDELFVSGVNHVIYHGTCYSPEDAPWPGWVFYASTQMNPRNAFWRDVPALNAYIARCQSILQAGAPDNSLLLYWPIHDLWHDADGFIKQLTVHRTEWLVNQPLGKTADVLWTRGYLFDYVSGRLLDTANVEANQIQMPGGAYQALLVPPCTHIPLDTFRKLLELAGQGVTIIFQDRLPGDVPGMTRLEARRAALEQLLAGLDWDPQGRQARVGNGRILVGNDLEALLADAGIKREAAADSGFDLIRRKHNAGLYYFLRYRGAEPFEGWLPLAATPKSVVILDPTTGRTGVAAVRPATSGASEAYIQCAPGASIILRTLDEQRIAAPPWEYTKAAGEAFSLNGTWQIEFIEGGPDLPSPAPMDALRSWTTLGSEQVERFAGTARYTLVFDAPAGDADVWWLDLGRVAESARARINGRDLGTAIAPPFRFDLPGGSLQPKGNTLEIEVTNLSANRIRDLDRRRVQWRIFNDINFVNIDYKPFDAAQWPLRDSGLLGPVTLQSRNTFAP